jgi:hypothetical protein
MGFLDRSGRVLVHPENLRDDLQRPAMEKRIQGYGQENGEEAQK